MRGRATTRGIAIAGPLAAALMAFLPRASADVFVLNSGGEIRGRWVNRDESPVKSYVISTGFGGTLVLDRESVKKAIFQTPAEAEYERIAPDYQDTVQDQWRLAEWCREHLLHQQRKTHLRRIVELEPDHVAARRALGYSQVGGEWVTKHEIRQRDGYQLYRGRWRLPQEIKLIEERDKAEQAEKGWRTRLRRWRLNLESDRGRQAYQQILAIRDPHAVRPLLDQLKSEHYRAFKMLYVEALGAIGNGEAAAALIYGSLNDPDEEVFFACVDQVVASKSPVAVEFYVRALKNSNNVRVNRAAQALARLDDKSAISPLIDALITTHQFRTPGIPGRSADSKTATFANPGAGGANPLGGAEMSSGDGSKDVRVRVSNNDVLAALVRLTETSSFGFDQKAWRIWYSAHQKRLSSGPINARRD